MENGQQGGLRIQLLGGFRVVVNGTDIPDAQWKSGRARSLIKLLTLTPGHRLHQDKVIDSLWPDSDLSAARNSFHQTLYKARRSLGPLGEDCLPLKEGFLSLVAGDLSVDVDHFEQIAAQARASRDPDHYRQALDGYTGELLPDDRYEEWASDRRETLRQSYLSLLLELARLHETHGEFTQGIAALQTLLFTDRSNEEAHALLMQLYARSGQRPRALRQYQALREALKAELDVEPGAETTKLYEEIRSGEFAAAGAAQAARYEAPPGNAPSRPSHPLSTAVTRPNNLPAQFTSFIGREKDIADVSRLLSIHRLVTLTGSGGVGKTRLALQVAASLVDTFPDGVWLIELAPLANPDLVALSVAYGLGMRDTPGQNTPDILANYLRDRHLMLVLDNCEHLIEACSRLVDHLLHACPKLVILATSREALGIGGETAFRLPSLTFPDLQQMPGLDTLVQLESVRLFVERAAVAQPAFNLTEVNAPVVAQICRRLDGIPLAIELAAARTRMMTVEQIAARLDDAFRLLTGGSRTALPRQQTLKAAIDWSYNQLPEAEKILLERLSVFAGGWTLEAAEQVCSDQGPSIKNTLELGEIFDLLGRLVDKSLVTLEMDETGAGRYRMLETVRQYAGERLEELAGSQFTRDRHLDYFLRFALEAEPHLRGMGQAQWLDQLEKELDNLRLAVEWGLEGQVVKGMQLANALLWLIHIHGHSTEGIGWFTKLLSAEARLPLDGAPGEQEARRLAHARGLKCHVFLALNHTDLYMPERLKDEMEESMSILRQLGSIGRNDLIFDLIYLGQILPEPAQAAATMQEGIDLARKSGDKFLISESLWNQAGLPHRQGDIERAEPIVEERLALLREIGDQDGIGSSMGALGMGALFRGEYARAAELFGEGLLNAQSVKNQWTLGFIFLNWTLLARAQGDYRQAVEWAEEVVSIFQALNEKNNALAGKYLLGMAAWEGGDYSQAVHRANEVLAMAKEIGPGAPVHIAHHLLGRTELSNGELARAQQHLGKMLIERGNTSVDLGFPPICNTGNPLDTAYLLESLAVLASAQGTMQRAVRWFGAIADWETRFMGLYCPRERGEHQAALSSARQVLGEKDFNAAWQAGQAMSLEQSLAEAKADFNG